MPTTDDPRVFLGWDEPMLPKAAAWLLDQCVGSESGEADLSGVMVVVPGSRAVRRLAEILAEQAKGRALVPPRMLTLGGLPGRLMPRVFDGYEAGVVDEAEAWLTRTLVLREMDREILAKLTPHTPAADDWPGWWSLAKQIGESADELGAGLILPSEVREQCDGLADDARWEAIEAIDRRYHAVLAERGKLDSHHARRLAIERGLIACDQRVILLATHDLMPVHKRMLEALTQGNPEAVVPLVFSPKEHAGGFDRLGRFVADYWKHRHPPIDEDDALVFADRPADQASAVVRAIASWTGEQHTAADQITVGVGGQLGGIVQRTLDLAGLPTRSAAGKPAARSRPGLLLQALAAYANRKHFDDLASLLRHPDVEQYVRRVSAADPDDEETTPSSEASSGVSSWLGLLDRYATDHLRGKVTGHWLGDQEVAEPMRKVYEAVQTLMPEDGKRQLPLADWVQPIASSLDKVFGYRDLSRFADADRPVVLALEHIGKVLNEMQSLPAQVQLETTFPQAIRYVLERLAGRPIAEPGGKPAIELVGFLELLLDDAPRLAIVGMNEGAIPEPSRFSALLPDGARRVLNLPEDDHRLARDKFGLIAMMHCRERTKLIAGRRSADGDPLMPSRLLLQADDQTLSRRISQFFEQDDTAAKQGQAPLLLLSPGQRDRFLIPYPVLDHPPIAKLRVTAFRDYLACPYRFYLKHVLRLRIADDREVELDAAAFGNLAHDTLRILGQPQLEAVTDAETVFEHLSMELDRRVREKLGAEPPAATRLQAEQLRYRLEAVAREHARMIQAGWRIRHCEIQSHAEIKVDGQPFVITGTIDRIDHHPELGYRIIDYKTGDTARSPDQTHRRKVPGKDGRDWADLQLPLYLDLTENIGVDRQAQLGYFNLPKKQGDSRFVAADWDADLLAEATALRDEVVRRIRGRVFWPPTLEPPRFDDGFAAVAADHAADRQRIIRASVPRGEVAK